MEIYNFDYPKIPVQGIYVAMGAFDGLHLGHQRIIERTIKEAKKNGVKSAVMTFKPHPRQVTNGQTPPPLLTDDKEKERLLREWGLDYYLLQRFTPAFAKITASEFIKKYLVEALAIKGLVVGEDFHFGYKGEGGYQALERAQDDYGFQAVILKTLKKEGVEISSTYIRNLISQGLVSEVEHFLGRPFSINGLVKKGDGRGRHLNYPTANLEVAPEIVKPKRGVYAAWAIIEGENYPAVVNFGLRPTFKKMSYELEVHLIGFKGNLYGREMKVAFVKYLREEMAFPGPQKLQEKIREDVARAKEILSSPFLYKCASLVVK